MNSDKAIGRQPSCVFICGKTDLFEEEAIRWISGSYKVVLTGEMNDDPGGMVKRKLSKRINIYEAEPKSEEFSKLIYSYSPDAVWYISGYTDGADGFDDEQKMIEHLIHKMAKYGSGKLIFVSSIDSLYFKAFERGGNIEKDYDTEKAFAVAKLEEQVRFLSERNSVKTVILRIPYIFNNYNRYTTLGKYFDRLERGDIIDFHCSEDTIADFVSLRNFTELLVSVTEETESEGEYTFLSGYGHYFSELGEAFTKINRGTAVTFDKSLYLNPVVNHDAEALRLKRDFGVVAGDDVIDFLNKAYFEHMTSSGIKTGFAGRMKILLSEISENLIKAVELILLFVAVQLLLKYTADNVYFRYVDLRLFFVVIMGSVHGMFVGIIAGILQCISLVFAYGKANVTGSMLFYNTDYWLSFAVYIMTGTITGYMMSSREQKLRFIQEEGDALRNKYQFLNDVYQSVIDNKEEYKRQILGYQDSFVKIFEAVEKLNSSNPADIFMNGVDTLERILKNHSIAIYTIDEYQKYARLVACSRELASKLSKSLDVETFRKVYEVIGERDTWKNTGFIENMPMYAYGIAKNGRVRLMIWVYETDTDQMSQHYMNMFTILCHLIRISFIRAMDYQSAIQREKYYEGTEVLMPDYFEEGLEAQRKMAEAGVATYVLLEIRGSDMRETDSKLSKLTRHSDIVGEGRDGKLYLLLTQTNKKIFETVGERLSANGIEYRIAEGM